VSILIPAARNDVDVSPLRDLFQVLEVGADVSMPAVDDAADAVLCGGFPLLDHKIDVRAGWRPCGCCAAAWRRRNSVPSGRRDDRHVDGEMLVEERRAGDRVRRDVLEE